MEQKIVVTAVRDMKPLGINGITLSLDGIAKEKRLRKGQRFKIEGLAKTAMVTETSCGEELGIPEMYFSVLTAGIMQSEVKIGDKVIPL